MRNKIDTAKSTRRNLTISKSNNVLVGSRASKHPGKENNDQLTFAINDNYIQSYLNNAFEPGKAEQKVTKEEKEKQKRKVRIKYITSKIEEMKKKRTFLTSWDAVVEQEPDSPPPEVQEASINSEEEMNNMLKDVLETQKLVRAGNDDLESIRRMIRQTNQNVQHHIKTIDIIKGEIEDLNQQGRDFEYCLSQKDFTQMNDLKKYRKTDKLLKSKGKSSSMQNLQK